MISYQESQNILHQCAINYEDNTCELVPVENCVGKVLAKEVLCRENNPPFDNSAMDGFAIKLEAIQKFRDNQWLRVGDLIAAGDVNTQADSFSVVEIMTGARIPSEEFNSVIKIEDVEVRINLLGQKEIRLKRFPELFENIRRVGEDSKVGDVLLQSGTRLTSLHLMIFATQGIVEVSVKKKVKIGIISTGKELVNFKESSLKAGQIRNSTAIYLNHELNSELTEVISCRQIQDDVGIYSDNIMHLLNANTDIIISTGAVSMGAFDFVKPTLEKLGAKIHFHKCAIRPGKPVLFASLVHNGRTRFIFGVPGNPVSTAVGYNFFIKPFISYLLKLEEASPIKAKLANDVKKPDGLRCFFKAELIKDNEHIFVKSLEGQASFMVSPFKKSNAWMVLPEVGQLVQKNTEVEVYKL